jgi:PAS domain S-box-containing protein
MKNRRTFSDLLFLIIILFLAIATFISYHRIIKLDDDSTLLAYTNQVKYKLAQALTFIRDVENREKQSIHEPGKNFYAQQTRDSTLAFQKLFELDSLFPADKGQQTRIGQLNKILHRLFENLKAEHLKAETSSEDLSFYSLQSLTILSKIQQLVSEMRHVEDDLLLEKIQEKDRSAFFTPVYSLLLSFLAILIVTVAYFRLRSETHLRKQAEDGQAIIHNFFQQVPSMLAILKGPGHVFEFANPPFLELIGGRDPINKPVREAVPEVAGQGYYEILDAVYKTGKSFTGKEMPLQVDRGHGVEHIFINFNCQVLKHASAKTDGILIFCYEVSELVLARNKLQETESRSRLAIEAARMGTFDWDLKNQQFISSERLVEIFGYHDSRLTTHQDLLDRFHPDDKPIRDRAVNNSFSTGSLKYEARLLWPDKSIHWVDVYGKILADEDRNMLRMYGTVVDTTPQKIALEEIKESEAKFRLLANAMPQQIWTADKNGSLNYFNQAVYNYSGLSLRDIESNGWLSIVHPDEQAENMNKWLESVYTGNEFIFEHRFRNFRGEYRWQLTRAIPQRDEQGNIQMWIGTSTDIQDQKHFMQELEKNVFERTQSLNYANLALKQTVRELEQTNSELASFNYIASHDLQEPLRKIIAFSKRIGDLEQKRLTDSSQNYFDRIIQAASRMQNLIDAFLSYSQTSNIRAAFELTDFNKVFAEVKNEFAETTELINICLESQPLPVLMGIPIQINQLFTNLIGNAIKYCKQGLEPKIEVFSEKIEGSKLIFEGIDADQQFWKISIRDNGIGFDQIYENQIFELFQRLHSRQEYAGTGIGLAICKKIMRNHKGFISASGKTGSGAVFSMYFPAITES